MGTGSKVLIVDDEERILKLLSSELEGEFQVSCAADGKEALKKIDEHGKPDLVITDILMPKMDGVELTRKLKTERPELPVLIVTALGPSEIPKSIRDYPTLFKPIAPAKILEAAKELLFL